MWPLSWFQGMFEGWAVSDMLTFFFLKKVSWKIFLASEKYLRTGPVSTHVGVDQRRGLGRQLLPARHDHGAPPDPGEPWLVESWSRDPNLIGPSQLFKLVFIAVHLYAIYDENGIYTTVAIFCATSMVNKTHFFFMDIISKYLILDKREPRVFGKINN